MKALRPPDFLRGAWLRLATAIAIACVIAFAAIGGRFEYLEDNLRLAGFSLSQKPASGQIHVVEMDAASIEAIREWPWSRDHYARVVEQLDAAGVRSIGFDVDFSSHSDASDDALFGQAIANASAPVALPTFAQSSSFRSGRKLDSLPIEPLREHAQLASVSIAPDPDGFIRRMPMGTLTSGVPRPSLSAFFAGQAGQVDESFPIDFSIAADTIPRHSFVNVERGNFDAEALRGKDVLIGATAIEMGDRYAVPANGVIPGVIVQALATETLFIGQPVYGSWLLPLTVAAIFAVIVMGAHTFRSTAIRAGSTGLLVLIASFWAQSSLYIWFDIVPALATILIASAVAVLRITRQRISQSRRTDRETGRPNSIALQEILCRDSSDFVVAAGIAEFDAIKAVLGGDDLVLLLKRVAERLETISAASVIHRTDDRVFAWTADCEIGPLEDSFAGLSALMRSPIEVGGRRIDVTLSFGVAEAGNKGAIANAAHAASEAQRAGAIWNLYEEDRAYQIERQISLMGELDEAVREGHIKVFYQPKLDLNSDRITCAEALVRWEHPTRGMISPDSFIPLAEESNRIEEVTLFVIRQTIEDLRQWCESGIVLGAAVNISARLLTAPSFVSRTERMLDELGVPLNRLTFEVTESAELEDTDASIEVLERFKARGIAISMDDYGTGQSTLSYLKRLPLSELKIDRSFVQHAHTDRSDAMLVRSTIELAHELGLRVVAEGVEDVECLEFLRSTGCDYAQGFLVGKPMEAHRIIHLLNEPSSVAA